VDLLYGARFAIPKLFDYIMENLSLQYFSIIFLKY